MYDVAKLCGGQIRCQLQPWWPQYHLFWHHEDAFDGAGHGGYPGPNNDLS
jgi:hypothetical protein